MLSIRVVFMKSGEAHVAGAAFPYGVGFTLGNSFSPFLYAFVVGSPFICPAASTMAMVLAFFSPRVSP